MGGIREACLHEDWDVVLERRAIRRDVDERTRRVPIEGEGDIGQGGGVFDVVVEDVVDVHSRPGELCSDDSGLGIARRVGRVVPSAIEHLARVDVVCRTL